MKILMVSIFSSHFFNWTEQLKNSGHEIYWLDVYDSNTKSEKIDFVHQITGWRYKWDFPGRFFIKKNVPQLYKLINKCNERKLTDFFEQQLVKIKPDVVHSFALHLACFPILSVMVKYSKIRWIYSSWGSDLYLFDKYAPDIEQIMPHINYIFTDCLRDIAIARSKKFTGKYLVTFPGPGGFDLDLYKDFIQSFEDRKFIAVKGYENDLGRCIPVLLALVQLPKKIIKDYQVVVFGASQSVKDYILDYGIKEKINLILYGKIPHRKVMEILGRSFLYIGNSISDGMPNTLLESIVMEACPVQSNPGGATSEIITDFVNGYLINDPDDSEDIRRTLEIALDNYWGLKQIIERNNKKIKPELAREKVAYLVKERYGVIENELDIN